MHPHIQQLKEQLEKAIQLKDRVVAVYLFGSFLKRTPKGTSDVDLAFLVDVKHYVDDSVKATSPAYLIAARVGMALDVETDVIIMNGASIEIAYEIITTGRCLYNNDQDRRLEHECKIKGMYFDFKPFLMELRSNRLDRIQVNRGA
jgi:predicted nucleotidyltransferase